MRILRHSDPDFSTALAGLKRHAEAHPQVRDTVAKVLHAVRVEGDSALLEFTERFGGPRLKAKQLRVTERPKVPTATKDALATARANVLAFARKSLRESWTMKNAQGAAVGERFDPFRQVTCDAKKLGIESADDLAPVSAVALGLALRKVTDR